MKLQMNGMELAAGFIGVLGARGAGKTRLLKQWAESGLVAQTQADRESRACYVTQELHSFEHFTVHEYLRLMAKQCVSDQAEVHEKVVSSLEQVNLVRFADHPISALSKLAKSQTLLAKALLCNSSVLLFDDILAGLTERERMNIGYTLNVLGQDRLIVLAGDVEEPVEGLFDEVFLLHPQKGMEQVSTNTAYSWVEGKVWEYVALEPPCCTDGRIVTAVKRFEDGVSVRVVAQEVPHEEVSQVSPTLTDAYHWWVAQR